MKLIVKVENQSFEVEVGDIHARPIIATIDGEAFEVWPEDVQLVTPSAQADRASRQPLPQRTLNQQPAQPAPASSAARRADSGAKSRPCAACPA